MRAPGSPPEPGIADVLALGGRGLHGPLTKPATSKRPAGAGFWPFTVTAEVKETMKREKSCGALVFRKNEGAYDLVLLRHKFGGHWSFPKGHVEQGENERQTALREVREETGLSIRLLDGFRESVEYFPKPGVKKQVVYFLGKALGEVLTPQEEEISEVHWIPIDKAAEMVTFANDKRLIRLAKKRLGIPRAEGDAQTTQTGR